MDIRRILFVCTANRCRSPMAEGLLRTEAAKQGIDLEVSSAGLMQSDVPAEPEAIAAVAPYGADISEHRSRRLTPEIIEQADLILTMERMHVREIALMHRSALTKAFPLKDLVRRAGESTGSLGERIEAWAFERSTKDLLGSSKDDEVGDPIGRPQAAFDKAAAELHDLTVSLLQALQAG